MKLKISDMMDDLPCIPVEIGEKEFVTASRIRAQTMQRLHAEAAQGKPVRRISGAGLAAAVIAAALCVSATAAVVAHKWPGFVFTGSMSEAEKDRMLEETSVIHAMEQIDADGTVHYLAKTAARSWSCPPRKRPLISSSKSRRTTAPSAKAPRWSTCRRCRLSRIPLRSLPWTRMAILRNLHLETRIWSCCTRRTRPALTCGRAIR